MEHYPHVSCYFTSLSIFWTSAFPDTNIQIPAILLWHPSLRPPPSSFCLCSSEIRALTASPHQHVGSCSCLFLFFRVMFSVPVQIAYHIKLHNLPGSFWNLPQIQITSISLSRSWTRNIRKLLLVTIKMIFLSLGLSQDQGSPAFSWNCSLLVVALEELYGSRRGQSLPQWLSGKESACNEEDAGSIPGLGRSPGEGNDNPLQYSCLENPKDRGA